MLCFSTVEELFKNSAICIPDTYLSWLREGLDPNGCMHANAAPCTWDTIIVRLRIFKSAEKEDKRRRQQQAKAHAVELKQLKVGRRPECLLLELCASESVSCCQRLLLPLSRHANAP